MIYVFQAVLFLWCVCSFRFCQMTNYLQDTFTYFEVSTLKWLTPICMQICVLCEPQLFFVIMPKGLHNHEFKTKWGEVRFYNKLHTAPARKKPQDVLKDIPFWLIFEWFFKLPFTLGRFSCLFVCFSLCWHKQLCAEVATKINVFLSMSIQK